MENKDFICPRCQNPLAYDDCCFENDGKITGNMRCISDHRLYGQDWWACDKCKRYYLVHQNCPKIPLGDIRYTDTIKDLRIREYSEKKPPFCQFIGFSGWFYNKDNNPVKTLRYYKDQKMITVPAKDLDENEYDELSITQKMVYLLEDMNLDYFPVEGNVLPTGPGGGYPHWWRCRECEKIMKITDKDMGRSTELVLPR